MNDLMIPLSERGPSSKFTEHQMFEYEFVSKGSVETFRDPLMMQVFFLNDQV